MRHRNEFVQLIDERNLKSVAEIGVAAGGFAQILLESKLDKYYGIDPWPNPEDAGLRLTALALTEDPRVQILEKSSADAAPEFEENSIDFVYIDAMHDYTSTLEDLCRWWPKTKHVLAGHDYGLWNHCVGCSLGVIPAVERFAQDNNLQVHLTGAAAPTVADRLLAAYEALSQDPGYYGHNIPSFYIFK